MTSDSVKVWEHLLSLANDQRVLATHLTEMAKLLSAVQDEIKMMHTLVSLLKIEIELLRGRNHEHRSGSDFS